MIRQRISFEDYRNLSDEEREVVRSEAALDWLREHSAARRGNTAEERHKPLTQAQLVSALADRMGVDEKLAAAALESLADIVANEVAAGGAVTLPRLGRFAARSKPARKVAKSGESVVTVRVAKELRDAARG